MATPNPKHQDGDIMPPDGTESEVGSSVLDGTPGPLAPKKNGSVRVKQTRKGTTVVDIGEGQPQEQPRAEPEAEIQSMVDVDSVRPSLPKAIRGTLSVKRVAVHHPLCEDGITTAIPGWCGDVNDSPGYQGEIIKAWGGGKYEVTGIDKTGKPKAVTVDVGGYSKPIPNTPTGSETFGPQLPPGVQPFDPGFTYEGVNGGGFGAGFAVDPGFTSAADSSIPDENGFYTPREETVQAANGGLASWVWVHAINKWRWDGPGQPPGPPPPMPGASAGQAYNPSLYDHSGREESRVDKLEKLVTTLVEEIRTPKANPMDAFFQMQAEARAAEAERKAEERDYQRRMDDREFKARESRETAEREERKNAHNLALETAKARAEADKEIARMKSEADKEAAKANAEMAKEVGKIQAEASKQLITVLTTKSEEGGFDKMFDRVTRYAEAMGGDKSEAERLLGLVPQVIDTAIPRLAEGYQAIKTANAGGAGPSGGGATQAQSDDERMISVLDVATRLQAANYPPEEAIKHLATACITADVEFEKVKKAVSLIEIAPPATFAAEMDKSATNRPDAIKNKVLGFKNMVMSEAGRKWILAIGAVLKAQPKK